MKLAFSLAAIVLLSPCTALAQASPCCGITSIDATTGIVTAKVTATGNVFEFKVTNARTLSTLKVGQAVYANFAGKKASLDGRTACCDITGGPRAPVATAPSRVPATPAPTSATTPARTAPTQAGSVANATAITAARVNVMPIVTVGAPQPRTALRARATSRFQVADVTAQVAGRGVTASVLSLRGLKAVSEAPDIPPGAKRVLEMLVRRVPLGESDHYVVDTRLAREWIAAHPVPDKVKPTEPKEKKCGNWYDSWDCAGQAVSDEWQRTFDHAVDEWEDAEKTLAEAWDTTVACFEERTISTGTFPVRFNITPSMTVNLSEGKSKGSADGTVSGSATLGVPMQSDMDARLDLFYIPCLPFAVRPKAIGATGSVTVGQDLRATVSATGRFDKSFTIPPSGGPVIPIQVFPIVIGGVPVAEVDVSAYIEGEIQVSSEGRAEGGFRIRNSNPTQFTFSCSGKGCSARSNRTPAATTTNESVQIQGTVTVKPAVYTALQLNFNYEALSARAGPQPYLLGMASGCGAASATQTSGGPSTTEENHVLSADLDWGVELRAEALVMGKIVGESYRQKLMDEKHLWFRDMAPGGSNALVARVEAAGTAMAGKRTDHKVRMPSCYPYDSRVTYQVSWTGGAAPEPERSARNAACTWQPAQSKGTCTFDPAKEFMISLIWPTPGDWALTVVPMRDAHDRVFTPAPAPTRVGVTVIP